ncbi:MAG: Ig-like domain-containing protein, partial [Sandaracinaceae bacterium]
MTGRGPLPLLGCGLLLLVGGCFRSFGLGVDGGADGGPLPADEGAPPIVEDGGPLPTDDGPPPSPDAGETPPLVLIAVDPTGPANDNMPVVTGTAVPNAEVILYASSACDEALEIGRGMAAPDGTFAIPVEVPDDAITVIHGVAAEAGRRPSLCSVEGLSYIEDSTPPPPPELLRTTPESPADEPMPVLEGEAEAGAVVEIFVDPLCTQPLAVTDATGEGTFEVALTVPEERETVLFGTATDAAGNRSECSSGLAYLEIGDPVGVVLFPPSVALTDEEEITVRGRIPVPLGVRRVRVDGERASTPNGWRDWTVDVDLEPGLNELPVTVELEGGRTLDGPIVEVVRRDLPTGRFLGAALDAGRGRLATIDNGADRLLAASLPTGALSVASGGEVGGGEPLTDPRAVTVDPAANRLYVALSERAVLEVNPVTGNRTELTGVNVGDGPAIGTIDDVAFGGGEVYVLDFGAPSVITEVDPTTGDRRELARYGMEVGARRPIRIAWDPVDDRVVALDVANREIVAVDADGTETVLSGPGLGLGLELPASATAGDVDGLGGDKLVLDGTRQQDVDPATGH